MKKIIKALILCTLLTFVFSLTGCGLIRPFDKPEYATIENNETAFLIDLHDNTNQSALSSESMLKNCMVTSKEIQIPHMWRQLGRWRGSGKWVATARLITVDRSPISREWSSDAKSGTSESNQSIWTESKESIGFGIGMNITAQIDTDEDAVKFLYSYNAKSLPEVMDKEIRTRIETVVNEYTGGKTMNWLTANKNSIMQYVRDDVVPYFAKKGINITTLGMKDGFEYEDKEIQKAINAQIVAEKANETAKIENKTTIEQAEAKAKADKATTDAQTYQIREEAKAQAEANEKLSKSLTDKLLKLRHDELWSQNFSPKTILSDDANAIINGTN